METGEFFDASTGVCDPQCPFPERCAGGKCVEGAAGASCAACCTESSTDMSCPSNEQWFQAGQNCVKCGGGGGQVLGWAVGGGAIALVVIVVWKISRFEGGNAAGQEKVEDAQGKAGDTQSAVGLAQRLSNTSLAASIVLMFAQFSLLALHLPFRFPIVLQELAHWLSSLINIDVGQVVSPECSMAGSAASTVMMTKFIATHFVYIGLNILLLVVGTVKGDRAHAFNAITATFTIALGALVKSCANRMD